ncbi:MAG: hypothetical protein HC817_04960 [Saprospiraceae bacterium]|nr:hypothetical protein [Saprospiraceae bacterium]
MSKEKFIYNKQSLQYEKVEVSRKEQALKIFGFFSAFIVLILISYPILQKLFPSAEIEVKNAEIDQLKLRYEALQKQTELNEKAVSELFQRDKNLYRSMFNVSPIDPSVLEGVLGARPFFKFSQFQQCQNHRFGTRKSGATEPLDSPSIKII